MTPFWYTYQAVLGCGMALATLVIFFVLLLPAAINFYEIWQNYWRNT